MPRRREIAKREIFPDPKYQNRLVAQFISNLMGKMTLDEKIGQLNLSGAGDITTGETTSSDIHQKIREGKVG